MAKKSNRRPQTPKGNPAMMRGFQELRKGSRTEPHPTGNEYKRKPKHAHLLFEEN